MLLWVPAGQARGGPVPVLSHRTPARAAQSTQDRRRGGHAARLRWERSLNVRQPPLLPSHVEKVNLIYGTQLSVEWVVYLVKGPFWCLSL